jgi:hypothetical protein
MRHPDGHPVTIFPYQWMFSALTNYLLLDEPLDADSDRAVQQVLTALMQGRSYLVNRLQGTAPAIPFVASQSSTLWHIGDSPSLAEGTLTLRADAGKGTEVRLIRDGLVMASVTGSLTQRISQPGVYRLEGYRSGRPWLFTNPIFVASHES